MIPYLRVVLAYSVYVLIAAVCVAAFGWRGLFHVVLFGLALSFVSALLRYPMLRYRLRAIEQHGRAGYLYGFSDIGQLLPVVKIGRSAQRFSRLDGHNTAAPFSMHVWFTVAVPDAVYAEWFLHQRYGGQRYNRPAEWFYLVPVMWWELRLLGIFGA